MSVSTVRTQGEEENFKDMSKFQQLELDNRRVSIGV